jgi:hypothetical protein
MSKDLVLPDLKNAYLYGNFSGNSFPICRKFKKLLMGTSETTTNQFISLAKAKQLTGKFKADKDKIVKDEFKGKHLLPTSETFDRSAIDVLLQLPGCVSLRIYFGMEEDEKISLVIVGVDAEGKDILTPISLSSSNLSLASAEASTDSETLTDPIVENGTKCPPVCPVDSPLNN